MAIMIPERPREFDPSSREDLMFKALEKLPDDYFVVHSFQINKVKKDGSLYDSEADFVVFNRQKGILCIEAKATRVTYVNGEWRYGSGDVMHSGGPFAQARRSMYGIIDEDTFLGNDGQNVLLYYVGTSRARLRLDMITTIDQAGCTRVLEGMGKEKQGKKPFKSLASTLNALPIVETQE